MSLTPEPSGQRPRVKTPFVGSSIGKTKLDFSENSQAGLSL